MFYFLKINDFYIIEVQEQNSNMSIEQSIRDLENRLEVEYPNHQKATFYPSIESLSESESILFCPMQKVMNNLNKLLGDTFRPFLRNRTEWPENMYWYGGSLLYCLLKSRQRDWYVNWRRASDIDFKVLIKEGDDLNELKQKYVNLFCQERAIIRDKGNTITLIPAFINNGARCIQITFAKIDELTWLKSMDMPHCQMAISRNKSFISLASLYCLLTRKVFVNGLLFSTEYMINNYPEIFEKYKYYMCNDQNFPCQRRWLKFYTCFRILNYDITNEMKDASYECSYHKDMKYLEQMNIGHDNKYIDIKCLESINRLLFLAAAIFGAGTYTIYDPETLIFKNEGTNLSHK